MDITKIKAKRQYKDKEINISTDNELNLSKLNLYKCKIISVFKPIPSFFIRFYNNSILTKSGHIKNSKIESSSFYNVTFVNFSFSYNHLIDNTFTNCCFDSCIFFSNTITAINFYDCRFRDCKFIDNSIYHLNLYNNIFINTNFDYNKIEHSFYYSDKNDDKNFPQDFTIDSDVSNLTEDLIGYKKCYSIDTVGGKLIPLLVTLRIPAAAKKNRTFDRKQRCSEAEVIKIECLDHNIYNLKWTAARSLADKNFFYKLGETIKVDDYDETDFKTCSTGIHFFLTREEAEAYNFS